MIFAWFILLTTNTHNLAVVALEIGGVAVCLAGYFMRKRIMLPEKDAESKDFSMQFEK
jgi:hypothetical protein